MSGIGDNSVAGEQLATIIQRIERLNEEKDALAEDIREVFSEAKGNGFDVKVLRKVIARRKRARNEVAEEDDMIAIYEEAADRILKDIVSD